jgi:phage-related protein (TIGR01555 family)
MGLFDRFRRAANALRAPASVPLRHSPDIIDDPNKIPKDPGGGFWGSASVLFNAITGIGTSRDPSSANLWVPQRSLHSWELFGMGRNALVGQALGKLGNTATREGWRVEITDERVEDPEAVSKQIAAYEQRLSTGARSARAVQRGRQYGQALVLLGIRDGRAFDQPVDTAAIKSIDWAVVIDKRDFYTHELYQADSKNFGQPRLFQITDINGVLEDGLRYGEVSYGYSALQEYTKETGGQLLVHTDRCLYFPTVDGLPLLDTLQDALGGFFEATSGIRTAARDHSTIVYKINAMIRKMWSADANLAAAHMAFVDRSKNAQNALILDKDNEDVVAMNRSLSGVPQLSDPFMVWLAAALAIPVTVLWGVSPGGFGKGDAERDTWHEEVRAFQTTVLVPQLQKLHGYILVAEDGCKLPFDTQRVIAFNDLSPPDEQVRSELRSKAISDLRMLGEGGYLSRNEVRASLPTDEYFHPVLDKEVVDKPAPAPVGVVTSGIALLQAVYPPEAGGIPLESARAFMYQVDPEHFPIDAVLRIFPDPTPATPSAEGTAPIATATGADPDLEDATSEIDAELEALFSQNETPPDAKPAQEVAQAIGRGVTAGQIQRRAKEGAFPVYRPPQGLNKRPRPLYSISEVKQAMVAQHATPSAPTSDWSETSLCIVIRLPAQLARWVPYKEKDTSPPHVTLVYAGECTPNQANEVRALVDALMSTQALITLSCGAVDYFPPREEGVGPVAYARIEGPLDELYATLLHGCEEIGLTCTTWGDVFKPHCTLAYLPEGETVYEGPCPTGSWVVESVEVWYGDKRTQHPLATESSAAASMTSLDAAELLAD